MKRRALALCAALATPCLYAQDSWFSGLGDRTKTRSVLSSGSAQPTEGEQTWTYMDRATVHAEATRDRTRLVIPGLWEVRRHLILSRGYRRSLTGFLKGNTFRVHTIQLEALQGGSTLTARRFQGPVELSSAEGKLVALQGATSRSLRPNLALGISQHLLRDVLKHGPGVYMLRGWTIDADQGCGLERTLLVDGLQVVLPYDPTPRWATNLTRTLQLEEPNGGNSFPKGPFKVLRTEPRVQAKPEARKGLSGNLLGG